MRRRRRRNPKGIARAFEVRIGAKRVYVDGAEVSHGLIVYWVDNVMTALPIKRKIEVVTLGPVAMGSKPRTPADVSYEHALYEERRRRETRAHEDSMKSELEGLMGPG